MPTGFVRARADQVFQNVSVEADSGNLPDTPMTEHFIVWVHSGSAESITPPAEALIAKRRLASMAFDFSGISVTDVTPAEKQKWNLVSLCLVVILIGLFLGWRGNMSLDVPAGWVRSSQFERNTGSSLENTCLFTTKRNSSPLPLTRLALWPCKSIFSPSFFQLVVV